VIEAGEKIVGENYVQEAGRAFEIIRKEVKWHFIGHLQKNKVKKSVKIFDMIETVDSYPYFIETRKIFKKIKALNLPRVEMKYLSMGMTNSYQIAIEEKANMVRIGTLIFGKRNYKN